MFAKLHQLRNGPRLIVSTGRATSAERAAEALDNEYLDRCGVTNWSAGQIRDASRSKHPPVSSGAATSSAAERPYGPGARSLGLTAPQPALSP